MCHLAYGLPLILSLRQRLFNQVYTNWGARSGFYLGYLTGRSFPPPPLKTPSFPPKYCYHYSISVTTSEKSSRRDEDSAHEVSIPSLMTKCTRFASQRIFVSKKGARFKKGTSWPSVTQDFSTEP